MNREDFILEPHQAKRPETAEEWAALNGFTFVRTMTREEFERTYPSPVPNLHNN